MPTPDPALVDTDVASVLYRARLFRRLVPAGLVDVVAERPLAISVVIAWGGSATANGLPLVTLNRRHFEPLTLHRLQLM